MYRNNITKEGVFFFPFMGSFAVPYWDLLMSLVGSFVSQNLNLVVPTRDLLFYPTNRVNDMPYSVLFDICNNSQAWCQKDLDQFFSLFQ